MKTQEEVANFWGEEYDFPLKKDGKTHPEYKKILNLLYENEKLKARVKYLEERHYYDGYKFRNKVVELRDKIKALETKLDDGETLDDMIIVHEGDNTIYYKSRLDMFNNNPCTKEEYEKEKNN